MQAFSKSLLVMFVLQILLSASCVTTASAQRLMQHEHIQVSHCHADAMDMAQDMGATPDCQHCDEPDTALMTASHAMPDMSLALVVAVLVMPEVLADASSVRMGHIHLYEPPSGSSLLYRTSPRILI